MPKIPPPSNPEPSPSGKWVPRLRIGRWRCPRCGAIHHFDSQTGCHAECGHKGRLIRTNRRS